MRWITTIRAEAEGAPLEVHALCPAARHLALKVRGMVEDLAERFRSPADGCQGALRPQAQA